MRRLIYAQRHRCICLVTNHMEERTSPPEIQPGDALGLRKTSMDLFDGDSLDSFGNRPLIAERVNHGRHSIALNCVAWFLDRSCACIHGTSENKIDIRDVNIKCTAGRLTSFKGPHHRNDRVADTDCHVGRLCVWRIMPVQ